MENTDLGKAEKRIDQTIKKAVKAGKWPFPAFVGNKWVSLRRSSLSLFLLNLRRFEVTMKEHKKLVFELAKPGQDIVDELTPMQAFALHMAIGVSGEAGELLDTIKKFAIYQKPLDFTNLVEELGDIEFYPVSYTHLTLPTKRIV